MHQVLIVRFNAKNFITEAQDFTELFKYLFIEVFIFHYDLQLELLIHYIDVILPFNSIE